MTSYFLPAVMTAGFIRVPLLTCDLYPPNVQYSQIARAEQPTLLYMEFV